MVVGASKIRNSSDVGINGVPSSCGVRPGQVVLRRSVRPNVFGVKTLVDMGMLSADDDVTRQLKLLDECRANLCVSYRSIIMHLLDETY